jgi:hypothetical protein
MLKNFFRLNDDEPIIDFDEVQLATHAQTSTDLRNVVYLPSDWPTAAHSAANSSTPMPKQLKKWKFNNVSLSKTKIAQVTFTDCVFEDCLFLGTIFLEVEFHRCRFINCNFNKAKFIESYLNPNCFSFGWGIWWHYANTGVSLFQELYENSSKSRQSDFQATADFKLRKWKRWQQKYEYKHANINIVRFILELMSSFISEWTIGFGYRPFRFIITTLLFFTAMSFVNMQFLSTSLKSDGVILGQMSWPDAIFYTYSLMTALGFSSIIPITSCAKIVAVGEGLCGIGWLGIFTSLLVKRFIR